ncbi:hypothetical protein SASPL_120909 [Salvia splendens]|uniref:mRNA cap-binding protein n=1 Tax=Salvia splendens TaxID=180675 RepID=A0A8X8XRF5_SALSN|nr:hypothetical protein SASPL_120909 [Salvia splendens]
MELVSGKKENDASNNTQTSSDEDRERLILDLKAGLHPLRNKYVFWYTCRTPGVRTQTSYEDNIKKIVDFSTDFANCNGGKWIIRLKKAVSGHFWEDLLSYLQILSIRFNEDILSVWNRNASDHQAVMALRDSIKRHLRLPHSYVMEYKPHDASLRDNSSYRNTWLRGEEVPLIMEECFCLTFCFCFTKRTNRVAMC